MDTFVVEIGREDQPQAVRADHFAEMIQLVVSALAATERPLLSGGDVVASWRIARLHSSVPTLELAPIGPLERAEVAAHRVIRRFTAWEVGRAEDVDDVPLAAEEMAAYKQLAMRAARMAVRFACGSTSVRLTDRSREAVERLMEPRLRDVTTLEGRLDHINVHEQFQAGIYEWGTGRRIPCRFAEPLWPDVVRHLRQYVLAEGEATYGQGRVASFEIWSLQAVPDVPDAWANPREWVGIGHGQYDGLLGDQYLRRLWGEA